jgi:hypothetical protein
MYMQEKTLSEIIYDSGMSNRPEFYSGRGVILDDLNSGILEKIYQGIVGSFGKVAGESFITMVESMPKLTATDFLLTLHTLQSSNWVYNKPSVGAIEIGKNKDGEYDLCSGFAAISGILFGDSKRDETYSIRGDFLRSHGRKEKEREKISSNGFYDYR